MRGVAPLLRVNPSTFRPEVQKLMNNWHGRPCRLNFRLRAACEGTTEALCPEACGGPLLEESSCGGTVLRCLTDKTAQINSTECLKVRHPRLPLVGCQCAKVQP